jgi:hypothetical protein
MFAAKMRIARAKKEEPHDRLLKTHCQGSEKETSTNAFHNGKGGDGNTQDAKTAELLPPP